MEFIYSNLYLMPKRNEARFILSVMQPLARALFGGYLFPILSILPLNWPQHSEAILLPSKNM